MSHQSPPACESRQGAFSVTGPSQFGNGERAVRTPLHHPLVAGSMVLLVAVLLLFGRLRLPLLEPDEARYAEIPREMLTTGHWLVPVLHGQPYYHKPPLLYWLVMASYQVFGVHDWAARLVPCTACLLTIVVVYFWGLATLGRRTAFAAAMVLALSVRFIYLGRMLTMDGLLTLGVTSSLALAHLATRGDQLRWRWWLASAVACGLGVLTKGPVALVLVGGAVFLFVLVQRPAGRPRLRNWFAYMAILALVAGPWYVAVAVRDVVFVREFFWTHHVVRFLTPIDHQKPAWYFIPDLLLGTLPWSVLLLPLAWFLWRRPTGPAPELVFFLLAAGWCVLFFSAAGCKRPAYILPALPPLALGLGSYLRIAQWPARPRLWLAAGVVTFAILLAAVHWLLPPYMRKFSIRAPVRAASIRSALPVVCYPHAWDSVHFYLRREDVQVFGKAEWPALRATLQSQPATLVFVKSDDRDSHYLSDFRRALPASLQLAVVGRSGIMTAAIVQPALTGSQRP
ncbi:MAG TPA: glycosyltransferase family 39 protein [Gemmataceae bacterium]|nr:glycosyltransferase family 39 protein [Gemmataceae bacterium]